MTMTMINLIEVLTRGHLAESTDGTPPNSWFANIVDWGGGREMIFYSLFFYSIIFLLSPPSQPPG